MDQAEVDAARETLGWKWPVQQALWNIIREGDMTTWSDGAMLTEEVAAVLRGNGYEVKPAEVPTAPPVIERIYCCPGCKRETRSTIDPSQAGHWCSAFEDSYIQWEVVAEACPTCGSFGDCVSDD